MVQGRVPYYLVVCSVCIERNLPPVFTRFLIHMYKNQLMRSEWQGTRSSVFSVTNGTRQGAILSCSLFCLYIDQLLVKLKDSGLGCHIGHKFFGAFGYADDVTLNSPTLHGLQKMLTICENYGCEYDMMFNESTHCIKFSSEGSVPQVDITLNGKPLKWVTETKHLGNWIECTLSDDKDCRMKKGQFITSVNKLVNKFGKCPFVVKRKLFKSYCMSFYGSQAWLLDSTFVKDIVTAWNKAIRTFQLPYDTHRVFLPLLMEDKSLLHNFESRTCKYIATGLKSDNDLVKYIFQTASVENSGTIGHNMRHLMCGHKITRSR